MSGMSQAGIVATTNRPKGFLDATGQLKKLRVGVRSFIVMSLLLVAVVKWMLSENGQKGLPFIALFVVLGAEALTVVWLCFSVRCPRCGTRVLWTAIRKQSAGSWMVWLVSQTKCPSCGYQPESKQA